MKGSTLPVTYYDVVMHHQWPRFRHAIRQDIGRLRNLGNPGPIRTIDEFPSAMGVAFESDVRSFANAVVPLAKLAPDARLALLAEHNPAAIEAFAMAYDAAYHAALNFELSGRKTFFIRDGLVERLLATEIATDSGLVRLPFRGSAEIRVKMPHRVRFLL